MIFTSIGKKKTNKISLILEILKIMEERAISKDFVLQEAKRFRVKGIKRSMSTVEILMASNFEFISRLHSLLSNPSTIPQTVLPPTKLLNWFYTDVIASSTPKTPVIDQVHKIMVLDHLIRRTETYRKYDPKSITILPSGDGYAIGFPDTLESPLHLAIELNKLVNEYNKLKPTRDKVFIRSGIESGLVYFMKDLNGNDTVWGPGIIMARRVMDLGEEMHILTSDKIATQLKRLSSENRSIIHNIGRYPVKWEGHVELCNIYDEKKFGNKKAPSKQPESPVNSFRFNKVELILDLKNTKSMMTHHTQIWELENISNEPKSMINYIIDGDTPKKFVDLHVRVRGSNGKDLKIIALNAKNPRHKELTVDLDKPIEPGHMRRLKLEWDWEEPNRNYVYSFSSDCKFFRYSLNVPKSFELKQRVLKIVPAIAFAEIADPAPTLKYQGNRTRVIWEKRNALAFDTFKLEW